ncbi:MAG: ABC transporter permease [Lachnospiraceae bacterium]
MLFYENILLAFTGLRTNKMRTLLTMLGIIIGIASVIAIMTVGDSISGSVTSSMEEMGANNITVGVTRKSTENEITSDGRVFAGISRSNSMSEDDYISENMLQEFEAAYGESIESIYLNIPVGNGTAEAENFSSNVSILGVNTEYLENEDLSLLSGRTLTARDQEEAREVILVSDHVIDTLFDGNCDSAIGSAIDVFINNRYYNFTVVGVYEYDENASFTTESVQDVTTTIYLPLRAAKNLTHSDQGYSQITVVSSDGTDSSAFSDTIENYFNNTYYRNNESYEISAASMENMISSLTEMLSTISLAIAVIAVIAGISLLVGGIGVMNIMLVSITERTKEIGTRKALGATNSSIRLQFITESIVICIIGGMIGIILGIGIAAIATSLLGYSVRPSVSGISLSFAFSAAIGLFFGFYPANKAAGLNPIDALRYE